jgi:hypothetical protein
MSVVFEAYGEVPDYITWLLQQDLTPAYRYYQQQLQVLQWRWPGDHWVLKSPHHLFFLDVRSRSFPMRAWCRPTVILPQPWRRCVAY